MPARKTDVVARLRLARLSYRSANQSSDQPDETYVSTLVTLMDHFADHPSEYLELINECRSETKREHLF